ncbi:MAG: metallophosphoesterase family protein [Clostridiales bacterium]|nr:metallophosphoesterase family protein [Clostridiales bacterium]
MTKILFLADLHGNYVATLAMEQEIKRIAPDQVWFLGDAVGKGPSNIETCDWVKKNCDRALKGNWDEWIWDCYESIQKQQHDPFTEENRFYLNQIGLERLNWLHSLPLEEEILISGLHFRIFHGRPVDRLYQGYDSDDDLRLGFTMQSTKKKYDSYICADSHRPYIRSLHDGYAINTGSVGNNIGVPRAHALVVEGVLDSEEISPISFSILSVPYDNRKAADVALSTEGLPLAESFANEVLTGIYSR